MKKYIVSFLTIILVFTMIPQSSFAYNFDGEITKSGTYTFASNERADINLTDTYE